MQQHQRPTAAAPSVPIASTGTMAPGQVPGAMVQGQEPGSGQHAGSYIAQTQSQQGPNGASLHNNQLSSVYSLLHKIGRAHV